MIPPLTKKDQAGNLYSRPIGIETAIDAAMQQDIGILRRRAAISKVDSPDFVPMECLVHLVRQAKRRRDEQTMNILLPLLLARCEARLLRKIPDRSRPNAADIREEILSEFSLLFAEDGSGGNPDELDFYECRFNSAFSTFRIDFMRRETVRADPLEELPPEDGTPDSSGDEDGLRRISASFQTAPMQVPDLFLEELATAIEALPPDERRAIVLCCVLGYKEESDDPSEITAATLCKVTGRTIRNRLSRAAAKLSKFKEEVK